MELTRTGVNVEASTYSYRGESMTIRCTTNMRAARQLAVALIQKERVEYRFPTDGKTRDALVSY